MVILSPILSEEFQANKVQVACVAVLAASDEGTNLLVARVLVAVFSTGAATINAMGPAKTIVIIEVDPRTMCWLLGFWLFPLLRLPLLEL